MFEKIKMYGVSQIGGFLANCYSRGVSSALSSVPFYLSRSVLRAEVLERRNQVEQDATPDINIQKIILNDLQVMLLANVLMDGLACFAKAQGIPLPGTATGAISTALIGTLYRIKNQGKPLSLENILQDLFNGASRSFFIGNSIALMMPLCGYDPKDNVPTSILTCAGMAGEFLLHRFKKDLAGNYALVESEAKQNRDLVSKQIYRITPHTNK